MKGFNNVLTGSKMGIRDCASLPCNGLPLLAVSLVLLISLSCSSKENTPGTGTKEPAQKSAVKPPPGSMPLSAVLKAVEGVGYAPVIEAEFEEDHWKVQAYQNGQLLQLRVGLLTGEILPNRPPTLERPLSAVVKSLEDQGYGPILDVELDSRGSGGSAAWEIEAYKGNSEITVSVEPVSGRITPK